MPNGNLPHTAITSWSGFVYQGKVAIYHVLRLLENPEACTDFALQLDSLEDFAILDSEESVISMHQVKAKKTQLYSGYKSDFEKLKKNANDRECNDAKFHVARKINDKSIEEISSEHSPVEIYHYDGICYCNVDEIDQKIDEKLQTLLTTVWPDDGSKHTIEYAGKTRNHLDQIILKKVLTIHRIIHEDLTSQTEAAYTQLIPFSKFTDILSEDLTQKNMGEDYYLYALLCDLHQYYQHYCIEIEDEASEDILKKLSHCMKEIGGLDVSQMIQFIGNIIPHREFKFKTLTEFKENTFNREEFQEAFLTILQKLKQPEYDPKNFFRWYVEGEYFVPTAINKAAPLARRVCKRIVENAMSTDLDVMFEGNNLITSGIDVESIAELVYDIVKKPAEDEDQKMAHRITNWQKVSLVSLDNVIEVINV